MFLLAADTVACALRGEGRVGETILAHRPSELAISALTLAELRYGADRRRSRRLHRLLDAFTGDVAVLPFDTNAVSRFGRVRAALTSDRGPAALLDALIAAHALAVGATLVTHDPTRFRGVRGLAVVDWYG